MKHTAQELFDILNEQDECIWIEAKSGSESSLAVIFDYFSQTAPPNTLQ
jgi:hypothetical protein